MLRIAIEQAQADMVLGQPVADPTRLEHKLLNTGFALDASTITRLRELKVSSVWIEYPDLDFLDECIDPEIQKNQRELYGLLKEKFSDVQEENLAKMDYMPFVEMMNVALPVLGDIPRLILVFEDTLQSQRPRRGVDPA